MMIMMTVVLTTMAWSGTEGVAQAVLSVWLATPLVHVMDDHDCVGAYCHDMC